MAENQEDSLNIKLWHIVAIAHTVGLVLLIAGFSAIYMRDLQMILQGKILVLLGFIAVVFSMGYFLGVIDWTVWVQTRGDTPCWFDVWYLSLRIMTLIILIVVGIVIFLTGDISIVFTEGV